MEIIAAACKILSLHRLLVKLLSFYGPISCHWSLSIPPENNGNPLVF